MGRKIDAKHFNLIPIITECNILSRVKSFLSQSAHWTFMISWAFECVTGWKGPMARWVFFPHFSCLAWICHMQADCLCRCLKQRVTDRPTDSLSLLATSISGTSIILLHCSGTGLRVRADLLNREGIKLWKCYWGRQRIAAEVLRRKHVSHDTNLTSFYSLDSHWLSDGLK